MIYLHRFILSLTLLFVLQICFLSANQALSIKLEIEHALDKGVKWLIQEQNSSYGNWGEPEYPALTGLVLQAWAYPDLKTVQKYSSSLDKGFSFYFQKYNRMEVYMAKDSHPTTHLFA